MAMAMVRTEQEQEQEQEPYLGEAVVDVELGHLVEGAQVRVNVQRAVHGVQVLGQRVEGRVEGLLPLRAHPQEGRQGRQQLRLVHPRRVAHHVVHLLQDQLGRRRNRSGGLLGSARRCRAATAVAGREAAPGCACYFFQRKDLCGRQSIKAGRARETRDRKERSSGRAPWPVM